MHRIHWLSIHDPPETFPDPALALRDPDGLLAAGGDLSLARLLAAYERGIFPWYEQGQPVLWWSPDPRAVLRPARIHVSRSLRRRLRRVGFRVSFDRAFDDVLAACAAPRPGQQGTWITPAVASAFTELHRRGWAHSVEVWSGDRLVGGLYGLAMGRVFFGESMFSVETDASKAAMLALCRELERRGFALLDCQVVSAHLMRMGAEAMPRREFLGLLGRHCRRERLLGDLPEQAFQAAELVNSAESRSIANGP